MRFWLGDGRGKKVETVRQFDPKGHITISTESSRGRLARQMYKLRRIEIEGLPSQCLDGTGLDLLLTLYLSQREDKNCSISGATFGTRAAPTTALRWLDVLRREGLVVREADPDDGRRYWIKLTPQAMQAMDQLMDRWADILP